MLEIEIQLQFGVPYPPNMQTYRIRQTSAASENTQLVYAAVIFDGVLKISPHPPSLSPEDMSCCLLPPNRKEWAFRQTFLRWSVCKYALHSEEFCP